MASNPLLAPLFATGKEPLPPGYTEDDRAAMLQAKKTQDFMTMAMESCVAKTAIAGVGGFAIGGLFSLMSASFAYEDPLMRDRNATQKARDIFREMGKNMYSSGKGFAKVGALFAGTECVIEGYRGKNDMYNSVGAGFFAGGVLARNSGPKAVLGGGLAFAAFSAAIDLFLRREPADDE
ncbi:Tim17-domain-containing protein [Athelia psychrophila]|uniref:Mitochondrial import inner membrane translocase subunit TIM22 n=1 Tax=Athelia psychrophila TaxID=1759441 RepID=A0A165ZK23_9AGAM|nr:Tim17-domain-containing protein [Fibularhizoctonia sp. CBS 109695]